jgi:hypothetical protein
MMGALSKVVAVSYIERQRFHKGRFGPMTRYGELCEAYFAREPYQLAIDTIFRELPEKMRRALSDHLQAPETPPVIPSLTTGDRVTSYVDLCRHWFDENGQKTWELCPADQYLRVDPDGICHFTIGISLVRQPNAIAAPSMIFLEFTVESVDEKSAELQLQLAKGSSEKILIDLCNPEGYVNAAALITTCLFELLRDRSAARGPERSIGY